MSLSKSICCFFIIFCVLILAGCTQSQKEPAEGSDANDNVGMLPGVEAPTRNELEGVLYPKAVIRFKVGTESKHQTFEDGVHFENLKREKGHLTHDIDGDNFVLSWEYLGSDENSDNYQIALKLPGDLKPSQTSKLEYSGEHSVTFYKSDRVAVTIEKSMDNSNEDQP